MWLQLVLLAIAGAVGTLARYGLASLVQRLAGSEFPWGTFGVNILGCFAAGALWAIFESKIPVTPQTGLVILVGFMGAFTTFSAFVLETSHLLRGAQWLWAAGNMLGQNVTGVVALFGGLALGRWL